MKGYKFQVVITKDLSIAKEVLSKVQFLFYQQAINGLLGIIYLSLGRFKSKVTKEKAIFEEIGEYDYLDLEKARFEQFIFSDEKELYKKHKAKFGSALNNRWIQKVKAKAKKYKHKTTNKIISTALGGSDVYSFFAKLGIIIKWRITEA